MAKPMVTPETIKARNAFFKSAERQALEKIGAAAFRHPLTSGLAQRLVHEQWTPNDPGYREWKERRARGEKKAVRGGKRATGRGEKVAGAKPWIKTGRTLRAVTSNAPQKIGTKRDIAFGLNWRGKFAFFQLRSFRDRRGRGGKALQERAGWTVQRGSFKTRLSAWVDKNRGTDKQMKGEAALARADEDGRPFTPARPLFKWTEAWQSAMAYDCRRAIVEVMRASGLDAKAA